ncbi:MAG: MFS transporter [Candidatus Odinarchaeota archaeon]
MSILARFFGLKDATPEGFRLAKIIAILLPAFAMSFQISTTFYMIFIAESLGDGDYLAGIALVGILVVVQMAIQTALDYPTAALGDWIGHRWIIASAMVCYGIAFWLTSMVTTTTPFTHFLIIYILFGLGASQESGAFQAWFDNNYRVAMPQDKDRKQYGVFSGKLGMLWQIASVSVLIPGSFLALVYGREWVFWVQAIISFVLAFLVLIIVKDLPGVRKVNQERPSLRDYGNILKDGVKFTFSSRFIGFIIFGEVLIWATGALWWNIILFPLYFSYLLTDVMVSFFRTIIFIPEAVIQERSGVLSKRFDPIKWVPRFRLLQFCGFTFYLLLAFTTLFFPPPDASTPLLFIPIPWIGLYPIPHFTAIFLIFPITSIIPIVFIFIIFLVSDVFAALAQILNQRVLIDVVPSHIRNSLYSFRPTLAMLIAMPLMIIFSFLLTIYRFPLTFALISLVALLGAYLTKKGFSYPVPKVKDEPDAAAEEIEPEPPKI